MANYKLATEAVQKLRTSLTDMALPPEAGGAERSLLDLVSKNLDLIEQLVNDHRSVAIMELSTRRPSMILHELFCSISCNHRYLDHNGHTPRRFNTPGEPCLNCGSPTSPMEASPSRLEALRQSSL